jgi:hypothetical protein
MFPVFFQTSKNFLVAQSSGIAAQGHNEIDSGQIMLMLPKTFTNETLDAVASYRGLNVLARYSQTKPRKRSLVILPENNKIFITGTPGCGKYALEIVTLGQTLCASKAPAG